MTANHRWQRRSILLAGMGLAGASLFNIARRGSNESGSVNATDALQSQERSMDNTQPLKLGWSPWADAEVVSLMAAELIRSQLNVPVERVMADIGVTADRLIAIPPGVPAQQTLTRAQAVSEMQQHPWFSEDVPVITYLGRQDVEKGIDLLLYACKILVERGIKFKLFIAGPTLFGESNQGMIVQLIENLQTVFESPKTDPCSPSYGHVFF